YRQIQAASSNDPSIHIFTNLTGVGNIEVNAFQRYSNVAIQKSIREGFGLVVSESLWKGTPVVAGRAGGIPIQIPHGAGGFLVDSVEECAERMVRLLKNPEEGKSLGAQGKSLVRERFLLTRLIADELRLYGSLLGELPKVVEPVATVGLAGEVRDPVCGMKVSPSNSLTARHEDRSFYFCSSICEQLFTSNPDRFLRAELHRH
ncbi:MAG: glycosyltransferase, partial [Bacteroidota bacterium]